MSVAAETDDAGSSRTEPDGLRFLRDPARDRTFAERGYAVLPDVLGPDEVKLLREDFLRRVPAGDRGMQVDFVREDREFLRTGSDLALSVLEPHLSRLFVDHVPLLASYVTKWPGDDSIFALHEDRTHVDPDRYVAANMWIALDDVGPDIPNGGLEIVPYSNKITPKWVGSETPDVLRPYEPFLLERTERPAVPAGSAVIYDNRTLHGSPPNTTSEVRVAVAYEIVPRGVEIIHTLATSRRHRKVYRVDADFLLDHNPMRVRQPDLDPYPLVGEFDDDPRMYDEDVLAVYPLGPGASPTPVRAPLAAPSTNRIRREARRLPWLLEDIPGTASTLPAASRAGAGWKVDCVKGDLAIIAVADPGAGALPSARLPAWARYLEPFVDARERVAIVVVDALASGTLTFVGPVDGGDEPEWRVDVVDVSYARGFLALDGHEETLDEEVAVILRGRDVAIWNHGPGALVVLVSAPAVSAPDSSMGPPPTPVNADGARARARAAVASARRVLGRLRRRLAGRATRPR